MKQDTRQDYAERMLRVLLYIQQNLDQPLPLYEVAQVAHFSPYHFHRIFRGMVGESLQAHVRRLRLERAASQLRHTDDAVITVALNAGFASHAAFTRAFKSMSGYSPTQWREDYKSANLPTTPMGVHYGTTSALEDFNPWTRGGKNMDVKIQKHEQRHVAFVRHIGPYEDCGQAWETLCSHLGPKGLLGPDSKFIGLCYDDPEVTPKDKVRYDACVEVPQSFQPAGDIGTQHIEDGRYAVIVHKGPFDNLKHTYANLFGQWLPTSGERVQEKPSLEIYLNDPKTTPPEELLVEIQIPLV